MDDRQILEQIKHLVGREHELRSEAQAGDISPADEQAELRRAEEALDQCWDLLRQRRARREMDEDPDGAQARPVAEVEGYVQ